MSMQFAARFTRYNGQRGERRDSDVSFFHAENFGQAYAMATMALGGMRDADPASDYQIMSLEATGYHGVDCRGGGNLFETQAEFSERVAAKASA